MALHNNQIKSRPKSSLSIAFFTVGIVLISFNLRPAITAVGPLVEFIQGDLHLSHSSIGLLTSLPLLAFFIVSPFVPKLAARISNERSLIAGLILIIIGSLIRSIFRSPAPLFLGTFFIGIGIGICNVLLPSIVKEKFPDRVGVMTSVYSTSMGIFASLASGLSVPLAVNLRLGWHGSLLVWIIPALLAIVVWLYLGKNGRNKDVETPQNQISAFSRVWKSPLAWQVALFFGLQSLLFYVTVTWFPEILMEKGYDMATAGWLLSLLQIIGLPASFITPVLAGKLRSQSWLALVIGSLAVLGYGGLVMSSSTLAIIISLVLIGIPLSGSFALGLFFISIRARNSRDSSELSGMAQSFGYLVSAVGPFFIGSVYDWTGSWTVPLLILVITSILVALFGAGAGRNRFV